MSKQIYIENPFQYEKPLIQCNDYLPSIDLTDVFFTIPLHTFNKKFVVFEFWKHSLFLLYFLSAYPVLHTYFPKY